MKPDDVIEITAPSVEEAIIIGLTRLAATRDEVNIEIVDEGKRGILGIGNRIAKVRISRKSETEIVAHSEPEPEPEPEPESDEMIPEYSPEPVDDTESDAEFDDDTELEDEDFDDEPEEEVRPLSGNAGDYPYQAAVEEAVQTIADEMLSSMQVRIETEWREEERPTIWIDIRGRDADTLVGPRAQTLDSIQYLFRTLAHRLVDGDYNVVVDADGYRQRRRRSLETLARKQADKAVETGRTVRLRAMPGHERRVIHMILREDDRVETESIGNGRDRAVTIIPVRD